MQHEKSNMCGDITLEEMVLLCISAVTLRMCLIYSSYKQYVHNDNIGDMLSIN
jgi:hypothetical protein